MSATAAVTGHSSPPPPAQRTLPALERWVAPPCPPQEFLFRGIQKGEWTSLFQFVSVKGLPVANLAEAERGPGGAARHLDLDLGDDLDNGEPPPSA